MLIVCYPIMHVTGMDPNERGRSENLVMHASVGERVGRGWRRRVEFPGVGVAGHAVLMLTMSLSLRLSKSMIRWTWSIKRRMMLRLRMIWVVMMMASSSGGGGVCRSQSLRCWMTILAAHNTLLR
jgi:hypothetical protein